ncbi:Eukaryotic translation initiation factor 4E-binding protein Mextli [Chionoecetes opilio]|uniref:Eukaryotic translation initiation factor 4E-binding protein Mextli n=1 Tax=Chionoecetes opilio TaxID=41210 RepID=A0A8J4Z1B0_CHIOP|nr:Eukaryotic translation initiation factor 4E-binding protein Mextli [Chionoecetes opilio]
MGIKGRRVHMIEELSETIISFQRVAPGARERLVQITGPAEDNISQARQLIEETIRRNASPVRGEERGGGGSIFTSLGGSSSSISSHTSDETLQGSKRNTLVHTHSGGDGEPLGEYRYTVTRGTDALRITGANLPLVRAAKLVLDEFFSGERNLNNIAALLGADGACDRPPSAESPTTPGIMGPVPHTPTMPTTPSQAHHQPPSPTIELDAALDSTKSSMVTVLRQPLFPSSSKEAIESAECSPTSDKTCKSRRALFQKTCEERANGEDTPAAATTANTLLDAAPDLPPAPPSPPPRRFYSRDFLVKCAASPLSRRTPINWATVVRQMPVLMKKVQCV